MVCAFICYLCHPFIQIHSNDSSVKQVHVMQLEKNQNKKFWWELICLSLHKLTVNNIQCHHLHTKFHPNSPVGSKVVKGFLCIHLRSLNICHFGMAEATRLKMWHQGHLQCHHLPTKFHENSHIGSKVISGTHTHTQAGDLIILLSLLESRLKNDLCLLKTLL
jgi:hypothetical protein